MSSRGQRIKELLSLENMSARELAKKTGCTETSMSRYIHDIRTPKADVMARIAEALNTSIDYLESGKGERAKRQKPVELLKLIEKNPDLPVIPLVAEEVVADYDYTYWLGSWGGCRVAEYLKLKDPDRAIIFKDNNDMLYTLEDYLPDEEIERLPATEEECKPYYDALPWKKAIIVNIELPED